MKIIIVEDAEVRKKVVAEIVSKVLREFGAKIDMADNVRRWKEGLSEKQQDQVVESLQRKYIEIEIPKIK